jgi:hypothetical protein
MQFVYLHALLFAGWMIWLERSPWPTLTLFSVFWCGRADSRGLNDRIRDSFTTLQRRATAHAAPDRSVSCKPP